MRRLMLIGLVLAMLPLAAWPGKATPIKGGIQYVKVDDGTEIAVQVYFPQGYDANKTYPALVEIEGYGGAASPNDSSFVDDPDYVVVAISLRGTGCSAGQLELFSDRSSKDGAWIIDNWIPQQSWYDPTKGVGIYGHSYGGLTGFLVASFVPDTTHLKAVAVSGLIDDFYRGILYPGGINNYGFPILWGAGVRPLGEHSSNVPLMLSDPHCLQNYADHRGSSTVPTAQSALDSYGSPFTKDPVTGADTWGVRQGLLKHAAGIKAPIQLGQQYQDEQTGPRGAHVLWENIPAATPKRIQISTGRHNPNDPTRNKKHWLDCWILNGGNPNTMSKGTSTIAPQSCADVMDPAKKVLLFFESMGSNRLAPYVASDWPLPETDWRRYYLRGDGTLGVTGGNDAPVTYLSTGAGRHMTLDVGAAVPTGAPLAPYGYTTGLPDTARYTLGFTQDTALAGPLELTLWATLSSPDNNFFAEILDVAPNGDTTFVQRGLLRAAVNAGFDAAKSQYVDDANGRPQLYRPYYHYTADTFAPIVPGTLTKFEIEIFPLGHVWRAGHKLVLQLHAPPANDPISTYAYEPTTPSVVQILQDAQHPTSILLPFMPVLPAYRATTPACGSVVGEVCVTPALG